MCNISDIYRSVCRRVLWWCWATINVLHWLETVETSPSLPGSSLLLCVVRTTGSPSHTFSPPGSRKRETSESILPNILFVPYPILVCASLGSECGHTGHRRTHGAQPSQVLAALLSTDINKSICPFMPCPKMMSNYKKNDLPTGWMLWILRVEGGGWCRMGCVCI